MEKREIIRAYIEENMNVVDDESFEDDTNIFMAGFVNSLFAMKFLNFVETEFNITIEDDEIEISNFSSVNNVINLINKKKEVKL